MTERKPVLMTLFVTATRFVNGKLFLNPNRKTQNWTTS